MRAYNLVLVAALLLPTAACGEEDPGPGEVAGVFPKDGFLGRKVTVEVVGDTTLWTAPTVNFGEGITAGAVTLVSPQALQVELTIAPTAAAGARDVTVTDGSDALTLPGAFTLKDPVMAAAAPNFEQGGFGLITITNLDRLNPFDTTTNMDGDFIGTTVTGADGNGVALTVVNVTENEVTVSAGIDVTATSTGNLTIVSGAITSIAPAVAVTPRTPQSITVGTSASFTMAENGSLLEFTAPAAGFLHIELTTTDTELASSPTFGLIPMSGKLDDVLVVHQNFGGRAAQDNRLVAAGEKFFIIAFENGFFGAPGYVAKFDARIVDLTGVTAVTDTGVNDAPNQAQALTGSIARFDGALSDTNDKDCFKITTGVANRKIHVFTTDENGMSDTQIEIFNNATAAATVDVTSDDADLGEDAVTANIVAPIERAICVSVSPAVPEAFGPYKAFVVIEQ